MSHPDVTLEGGIDAITALGGLQIDIGHVGIVANGLPEHISLIVAKVDTMDMRTRVLTLHIIVLCV
jgi:hypothetical protein